MMTKKGNCRRMKKKDTDFERRKVKWTIVEHLKQKQGL